MTKISYEIIKLNLHKSVFLINPNFVQPPPGEVIALALNLQNRGEFYQNDQRADFTQSFKIQGGQGLPFSLEVEMRAVFNMSTPVPSEEHEAFVHQAFAQMVFPHTREYVADITRRAGFPPLLLNVALFQESRKGGSGPQLTADSGSKWIH